MRFKRSKKWTIFIIKLKSKNIIQNQKIGAMQEKWLKETLINTWTGTKNNWLVIKPKRLRRHMPENYWRKWKRNQSLKWIESEELKIWRKNSKFK